MNATNKLAVTCIIIVLVISSLFCSAYVGARIERNKYASIIADNNITMGQLRLSLAESKSRIDTIGTGLGRAIDSASKLADRSARIKALISGIDEAIKLIRGSQ